jgi:hypothetical protein
MLKPRPQEVILLLPQGMKLLRQRVMLLQREGMLLRQRVKLLQREGMLLRQRVMLLRLKARLRLKAGMLPLRVTRLRPGVIRLQPMAVKRPRVKTACLETVTGAYARYALTAQDPPGPDRPRAAAVRPLTGLSAELDGVIRANPSRKAAAMSACTQRRLATRKGGFLPLPR